MEPAASANGLLGAVAGVAAAVEAVAAGGGAGVAREANGLAGGSAGAEATGEAACAAGGAATARGPGAYGLAAGRGGDVATGALSAVPNGFLAAVSVLGGEDAEREATPPSGEVTGAGGDVETAMKGDTAVAAAPELLPPVEAMLLGAAGAGAVGMDVVPKGLTPAAADSAGDTGAKGFLVAGCGTGTGADGTAGPKADASAAQEASVGVGAGAAVATSAADGRTVVLAARPLVRGTGADDEPAPTSCRGKRLVLWARCSVA